MDLFAPCRSCLQCLPFFHGSPPSSPRHAAAAPSTIPKSEETSSKATSSDPSHNFEELQCPDAAPAMQELDLPLNGIKEDAICEKGDGLTADNKHTHSSTVENEAGGVSEIIIAPPVSANEDAYLPANTEPNRSTAVSEFPLRVPFINDISFSMSGLLPLTSPITPAAIGAGYPAGEYYHHPQIHQSQDDARAHAHDHALQGHDSSHHGHDNSHHKHSQDHDHSHDGHDQDRDHSRHGHAEGHGHTDFVPLDAVSHPHAHLDLSEYVLEHNKEHFIHDPHHHNSEGHAEGHGHTDSVPLDAVLHPLPQLDLSESVHGHHEEPPRNNPHHHNGDGPTTDNHEHHKYPSHHDPHHHNMDGPSMDNAPPPVKYENPIPENIYYDNNSPTHELAHDSAPLPPLETSQSTPILDAEVNLQGGNGGMDMTNTTNGALAGLLQTFHSEPMALMGALDDDDHNEHSEGISHSVSHQGQRRRRRDQFKDQFKGISHQIKQGGHHIKEESSKHLQTIISNVNKQAQQLEQSGTFFNVPR